MSSSSRTCPMCLEGYTKGEIIKKLPCEHILHRECARAWLNSNVTCPICRLDLNEYFFTHENN